MNCNKGNVVVVVVVVKPDLHCSPSPLLAMVILSGCGAPQHDTRQLYPKKQRVQVSYFSPLSNFIANDIVHVNIMRKCCSKWCTFIWSHSLSMKLCFPGSHPTYSIIYLSLPGFSSFCFLLAAYFSIFCFSSPVLFFVEIHLSSCLVLKKWLKHIKSTPSRWSLRIFSGLYL